MLLWLSLKANANAYTALYSKQCYRMYQWKTFIKFPMKPYCNHLNGCEFYVQISSILLDAVLFILEYCRKKKQKKNN